MSMKRLLLAFATTAALSLPASATDWNGFYAGLNGGYGWRNEDSYSLFRNFDGLNIGVPGTTSADGAFGGIQIGYNWQRGSWIAGFESDFSISAVDGSASANGNGTDAVATTDVRYFGTVRGRFGYDAGSLLIYATGGLAYADVDYDLYVADLPVIDRLRNDGVRIGYTVGGGVERTLADQWSAKIEYQFMDFGSESLTGSLVHTTEDLKLQTVRFGLNYKLSN